MKIKLPDLIENGNGTVRVQSLIETREGECTLWYELDATYKDYLTLDRLDAFVVGMILYAMRKNEPVVVDGPISNKLARNLKYYMHVMNTYYPDLHVVPIHCLKRDPLLQCPKGPGAGASFTAGIDSYCTLWEHFKNNEDDGNRITHLFNMYAGQRGGALDGRAFFRKNLEGVRDAAKRLNLDLVVIDTNLDGFYDFGRFVDSYGPRLFSCVLLLQKLFSVFYIPATYQYSENKPQGSTPLGDHLLSTEVLDIVHDGSQYSRVEKTKIISKWEITRSVLIVCNGNFLDQNPLEEKLNCSFCEKCVRTMVTLDMLGLREQYEQVFDFTDFEKKRDLYICDLFLFRLVGVDTHILLLKQVKKHARELGYPLKVKPWKLLWALWIKLTHPASIKKLLTRTSNWANRS